MLQQLSLVVSPESINASWRKERAGEALNDDDRFYLYIRNSSRIAYWEKNHFQYQHGLLAEEQWEASKSAIRLWADDPMFQESWETERDVVRKSFADAIDEILRDQVSQDQRIRVTASGRHQPFA